MAKPKRSKLFDIPERVRGVMGPNEYYGYAPMNLSREELLQQASITEMKRAMIQQMGMKPDLIIMDEYVKEAEVIPDIPMSMRTNIERQADSEQYRLEHRLNEGMMSMDTLVLSMVIPLAELRDLEADLLLEIGTEIETQLAMIKELGGKFDRWDNALNDTRIIKAWLPPPIARDFQHTLGECPWIVR